ncbi:hypothetical protein GCM10007938_29280 [Vibrio zhanjiangensis]|uniref:Uncharacterized protein n=1 Tax=Vibrio zhanjiangensis TaxID=1046128 RepID=A0ABQ6F1M3_9VIBR|nr:hypothetical protein [Vibrio zhanjiangensis]GLT19146.1 hypothetical protein GCM10007938_29280 [Vibrio zhanjiangensis]
MNLENIKQTLRTHIKSIGVATIGLFSATAVPIWQIYFVETSDIEIEIGEIRRIHSNDYRVALSTEELQLLKPYIDEELFYEIEPNGERGDRIRYPSFDVDTLIQAYEKAKIELKNIAETKRQLSHYIDTIDAYLATDNLEFQLIEFRVGEMKSWGLSNYIDDDEAAYYEHEVLSITRNYSDMTFKSGEAPRLNAPALAFLLSDVKEDLLEVITTNDMTLEKLRDSMRGIDAQINKIQRDQQDLYSYFEVDVVATNNGRASAALRPIGLIRVTISSNNYVDINLEMDEFQTSSELPPSSTRLIRYHSFELHQMPVEDRNLVNAFWGTTGQARLLNLDTKRQVYASKPTVFADKSSRKVLFDQLKKSAASL